MMPCLASWTALGQRLATATDPPRSAADADRMRTALLAAVSHDLRSPLAAAKAAVSCLRSRDIQLAAADQDDLLATAEESLDLLTHLVASLLDVTRLQAGAPSVFPRPADLEEMITCSLGGLGPAARTVTVSIPPRPIRAPRSEPGRRDHDESRPAATPGRISRPRARHGVVTVFRSLANTVKEAGV
jgi:two-component system sensor histidine kinase KdpD